MPDLRSWLHRASARFWYDRIALIGGERLPERGPALYLGLHRNGAVDGLVHRCVLRRTTFLLAARWRKGLLRRALFDGIVVVREKDGGDRGANAAALAACVEHLRQGGELDVFPEGTSSLGPRHLPFKTGAARILSDFLASGGEIPVLPIGLHYERAWAFRSRVEVVVGEAMDTRLEPGLGSEERVRLLHARIGRALEEVGVNLPSEAEQVLVESLAYAATLGTRISYFQALKAFEEGVPDELRAAWIDLERDPVSRRALLHQGVPLVPTGAVAPYALLLLVLGPIVLAAIVANLPPLLLALWAGRKLPDDRNVIALWRLLVGLPAFLAWSATVIAVTLALHQPLATLLWAALTSAGLMGWYRTKKLAVAVHNATFCASLKGRLLEVHRRTVEHARKGSGE